MTVTWSRTSVPTSNLTWLGERENCTECFTLPTYRPISLRKSLQHFCGNNDSTSPGKLTSPWKHPTSQTKSIAKDNHFLSTKVMCFWNPIKNSMVFFLFWFANIYCWKQHPNHKVRIALRSSAIVEVFSIVGWPLLPQTLLLKVRKS